MNDGEQIIGEQTVGERTRPLQSAETPKPKKPEVVGGPDHVSWMDRLTSFARRKPKTTGAAAATIAGAATLLATGTADNALNIADQTVDTMTSPFESLNDVSDEFITPKEVFAGSINVSLDGELNGRKQPNTDSAKIDWDNIKLVTSKFDSDQNKNVEDFIEAGKGFSIDNPLIVLAQDADGGAGQGRWLKLPAINKDGDRFDVYVSISQQTFPQIDLEGEGYIGIKTQKLKDGKQGYMPAEPGKDLPNGEFNHIRTLTPPTPQE